MLSVTNVALVRYSQKRSTIPFKMLPIRCPIGLYAGHLNKLLSVLVSPPYGALRLVPLPMPVPEVGNRQPSLPIYLEQLSRVCSVGCHALYQRENFAGRVEHIHMRLDQRGGVVAVLRNQQ